MALPPARVSKITAELDYVNPFIELSSNYSSKNKKLLETVTVTDTATLRFFTPGMFNGSMIGEVTFN